MIVSPLGVRSCKEILLKNPLRPSTKLRACPEFIEGTNGNYIESIDDFPFVLRLSKHERSFFSRIATREMSMDSKLVEALANQLRHKRLSLLEGVAGTQRAATAIIEERESEIEESAQKDRIARLISRLTDRDQEMIQQINATLKRIDEGTYGQCAWCESDISSERLRALPTAILCIDCATAREKRQRSTSSNRDSKRLIANSREYDGNFDLEQMQE